VKKTRKSSGFVPLKDLAPRSDPHGGAARKAVFGERAPVPETADKESLREAAAERRNKTNRKRKKGDTT
jgi:hypothetical protein